jgi:hypothetical protein
MGEQLPAENGRLRTSTERVRTVPEFSFKSRTPRSSSNFIPHLLQRLHLAFFLSVTGHVLARNVHLSFAGTRAKNVF